MNDGANASDNIPVVATAIPVLNNDSPFSPSAPPEEITAPFIPTYEELSPQKSSTRLVSERLKIANEIGRVKAGEDAERDEKNVRKIHAHYYHANEAVKEANRKAKQRDKAGLEIKEDEYHKENVAEDGGFFSAKDRIDQEATTYKKNEGGYEVSEYETSDYQGMEYDSNYEYKSVYD